MNNAEHFNYGSSFSRIEKTEKTSPTNYFEFQQLLHLLFQETNESSLVSKIIFNDPSILSSDICQKIGISQENLIKIYHHLQSSNEFQMAVNSPFYSKRIMFNLARNFIHDWNQDKEYFNKLINGESVSSRTVEMHTTRGTCNYRCKMCLWSDKDQHTYKTQSIKGEDLMDADEWKNTLLAIKEMGAKTAVFSGGGEVLLNQDFFTIADFAKEIGLMTQLYTNGYNMNQFSNKQWQTMLNMDRIRFSIHSPYSSTYNEISQMPANANALQLVMSNLENLLKIRNQQNQSKLKVGIGFVIQPLNAQEIEEMANLFINTNADYLNIRRDEILVTDPLSKQKEEDVKQQLITVRSKFVNGDFGSQIIDFSDNLTALMNGEEYSLKKVSDCLSKYYRPSINPYGLWTACDLKSEPMYFDPEFVFGDLHKQRVSEILTNASQTEVPANCESCMPSGQTGNAIFSKILQDYKDGFNLTDQLFY